MSAGAPLWRRAFDTVERRVGGPLEEAVASPQMAQLFTVGLRLEGAVRGTLERQTRRILHFWNLPARSDVARLNRQVAALAAEVRALSAALEDERRRDA